MQLSFSFNSLSLRTKLICYLLVTSQVSIAIVGVLAHQRLMQKFDGIVMREASRNFQTDVQLYFRTYGTWAEGMKHETFRAFTERRRAAMQSEAGAAGAPPPDDAPVLGLGGPPPQGAPSSGGNMPAPPFRFYLFDADHRALFKRAPYQPGDLIRDEDLARMQPILVDGRVVAYSSPQGEVNYSDLDLGYMAAMRESLLVGTAAGMLLTLVLGVVLGNRLSHALRKLTRAVHAMGKGDLRQRVPVESQDEAGVLAQAFNRMSDEIAQQYEDLRKSHAQIETMAAQMRELSMRDVLTGLHNRRYFDDQCAQLLARAQRYQRPFSVMMGDIDHFKNVNDRFSHAIGDEVLRRMGEILQHSMRASDLVARYGGEEFVVAFPETGLQHAKEACEALRLRVEAYPWHEVHPDLRITISMGLSSDIAVASFHTMLEAADALLYHAKRNGRNQVCSALPLVDAG
jgi:two-component system cell cycle response regulator